LKQIVIAVDIGSSGIKALAFDLRADPVPGLEARAVFSLTGGRFEFAALKNTVESVLDKVHAQSPQLEVLGVGFGSFASSLVALDEHGTVMGPSLSYADTRSAAQLHRWRNDAPLIERTGCPPYTSFWTAQIAWWLENQPKPARFLTVTDALFAAWFGLGSVRCSLSAAAWTGLLNRHSKTWDEACLERLGLRNEDLLPVEDHPAHTDLLPGFALRWPRFKNAAFFAGVADGFAANVGSGVTSAGHCAITVGTSAALRTLVEATNPPIPAGLWALPCTPAKTMIGGALTEGGNLYAWAISTLRLPEGDLEAALEAVPPDGHGLSFVPTLSGERSPGYDPSARGAIHGIDFDTSAVDILRAAMEGVTYRLADLFERLERARGHQDLITLSGNALGRSGVWRQMIADALGRPVILSDQPEATARGVAVLALQKLGGFVSSDLSAERGEILRPNAANFERYARGLKRSQAFLKAHETECRSFQTTQFASGRE
jgi:gluconokinase